MTDIKIFLNKYIDYVLKAKDGEESFVGHRDFWLNVLFLLRELNDRIEKLEDKKS